MRNLQAGIVQTLTVKGKIEDGFLLGFDNEEVILPEDDVTTPIQSGEEIDVFLYHNRKGTLTASMNLPDASLESFGWAEVVEVLNHLGVFVDIGGLGKEMLVSKDDLPLMEQVWPKEGDWLFVSLEIDKKGKLLARPVREGDILADLEKAPPEALNQQVTGRVYRASKAGSFILTGEGYRGFIHPTERKEEPRLGQTIEGRIIGVKEDGTVNISLLPLKQESRIEDSETILNYLLEHDGELALTDKSDPEAIRKEFSISKAAFKRAMGKLMKENKVVQENGKTYLKEQKE